MDPGTDGYMISSVSHHGSILGPYERVPSSLVYLSSLVILELAIDEVGAIIDVIAIQGINLMIALQHT